MGSGAGSAHKGKHDEGDIIIPPKAIVGVEGIYDLVLFAARNGVEADGRWEIGRAHV